MMRNLITLLVFTFLNFSTFGQNSVICVLSLSECPNCTSHLSELRKFNTNEDIQIVFEKSEKKISAEIIASLNIPTRFKIIFSDSVYLRFKNNKSLLNSSVNLYNTVTESVISFPIADMKVALKNFALFDESSTSFQDDNFRFKEKIFNINDNDEIIATINTPNKILIVNRFTGKSKELKPTKKLFLEAYKILYGKNTFISKAEIATKVAKENDINLLPIFRHCATFGKEYNVAFSVYDLKINGKDSIFGNCTFIAIYKDTNLVGIKAVGIAPKYGGKEDVYLQYEFVRLPNNKYIFETSLYRNKDSVLYLSKVEESSSTLQAIRPLTILAPKESLTVNKFASLSPSPLFRKNKYVASRYDRRVSSMLDPEEFYDFSSLFPPQNYLPGSYSIVNIVDYQVYKNQLYLILYNEETNIKIYYRISKNADNSINILEKKEYNINEGVAWNHIDTFDPRYILNFTSDISYDRIRILD